MAKRPAPMRPPALGADLRKFARKAPMTMSGTSSIYKSDIITLLYQSLKVLPDPDEVLRRVGMNRGALRKLVFDDEIAQAVDTRRDAATNTPWRLEGGSEEANKFITAQFAEHEDLIFPAAWNSRLFGYSVTQIVYKRVEGRIGIGWVGEMPFEFYFPQRDGTCLFRPEGTGEPVPLMPEKYLIPVINPTYANPYGDALLSRLYWLWFFRTHGWQYWAQWLESFGSPFLVGKTSNTVVDPVKGTKATDVLAAALDKARRGSAIAIDKDSDVEAIEMKGTGQQFVGFDDACSRQIAKVILGQTLTSSEGKHGTQALGAVHEEVRQDKKRADVRVLRRSGQWLVNHLFNLNGFSGDVPKFVMEDEKGIQKDRAERDANFTDKGVVVFTRAYLEEIYDFEAGHILAPGEPGFAEAKGTAALQGIDPATGLPKQKPSAAAEPPKKKVAKASVAELLTLMFNSAGRKLRFTPEQEVIEDGIAELTEALPSEVLLSADIQQAIREASDPNDLMNRLAVVLQDSDPQEFRATVEKALFAAEVIGYVHSSERTTPLPAVTAAAPAPTPAPEPAQPFHLHVHAAGGPRVITKNPDGTWRSDPAATQSTPE